jgi:hypothetical protein
MKGKRVKTITALTLALVLSLSLASTAFARASL